MTLQNKNKRILIVAAHPDDETLGCGGTIAREANLGREIKVLFLADGVSSRGLNKELLSKRKKNAIEALNILGVFEKPIFLDMRDNQLDTIALLDIVKKIEKILTKFKPDAIYTHSYHDLNVDHQIAFKAVMTAARPSSYPFIREIYSFEILSSSEWSLTKRFNPNYFVDITSHLSKKVDAFKCYSSELNNFPNPRSVEAIKSLAKIRGSEVGIVAVESFEIIRLVQ